MTPSERLAQNLKAKELFERVVDLPQAQRQVELAGVQDATLLSSVRKLLAADDAAGGFLRDAPPAATELRQLGPYTLLQPIGEGGFGTVYMAEQTEPLRRRVALKILKPGMDSRTIVARFEAERQALALMEHPNIARVFDAGTSPDGRPYFVMELVNGVPITRYCDEAQLTLGERLKLFINVCQAVHHAHQKGIIHRDIKPSNVLVTLHDGVPVPKVIDFGIAKALDRPLTDKTLFTEFRAMIGTPEYMSPEQAEISGLDVDTRSDVYSLGVLLYELLAGVTPFDAQELRSKAYGELQRIIKEVDPPRPSDRVSTLATQAVIASARRTEARRLSSSIRGELDWIVMKCLEKDRRRRYDSPSALAVDIDAYLHGHAVLASPPSRLYQLRKFVRRNQGAVFATVAVVAALAAGLSMALIQLQETRRQRVLAESQRVLAEQRAVDASRAAERAQASLEFLVDTIQKADPTAGVGDPPVSQVFERAVRELDQRPDPLAPETEAMLRTAIGRVLQSVSRNEEGWQQLTKAVALRRAQTPPDRIELPRAIGLLAAAESTRGNYALAHKLYDEAIQLAQNTGDFKVIYNIRFNRASLLAYERRYDEGVAQLQELATLARQKEPGDVEQLARNLEALSLLLTNANRANEALPAITEAVELRRRQSQKLGRELHEDRSLLESIGVQATVLGNTGKTDEAISALRAIIEELGKSRRPATGSMAMFREMLGRQLTLARRYPEAVKEYELALSERRELDGPTHQRTLRLTSALATELYRTGQPAAAKALWQQAWAAAKQNKDMPAGLLADIAGPLAMVSTNTDSPSPTELYDYALTVLRSESRPRSMYASTLINAWQLAFDQQQFDRAGSLIDEAMGVGRRVYKPDQLEMSHIYAAAAYTWLAARRDPAQVLPLAQDALRIREGTPGYRIGGILSAKFLVAWCRFRMEPNLDNATALVTPAREILAIPGLPKYSTRELNAAIDEATAAFPALAAAPATAPATQPSR